MNELDDSVAFSILERIDDVVTAGQTALAPEEAYFQYPRTDRRCCDRIGVPGRALIPQLSVSSNGSTML